MYQKGKTVRRSRMSLVFCENSRGFTRVAVVVSKKVDKSAVGRNRIRRRVYEAIRGNFDCLPSRHDYIFVIYSNEVMKMPFNELVDMINELATESKVCYNKGNNE